MSACLVEGDLEQAERANWMIEVEKKEKEKDRSRMREKGIWCPSGTVKHCFSSGDGSEEREREKWGKQHTDCMHSVPPLLSFLLLPLLLSFSLSDPTFTSFTH